MRQSQEPQNHRLLEGGRHLWRSSGPANLAQAEPLRASCPGPCPGDF